MPTAGRRRVCTLHGNQTRQPPEVEINSLGLRRGLCTYITCRCLELSLFKANTLLLQSPRNNLSPPQSLPAPLYSEPPRQIQRTRLKNHNESIQFFVLPVVVADKPADYNSGINIRLFTPHRKSTSVVPSVGDLPPLVVSNVPSSSLLSQ